MQKIYHILFVVLVSVAPAHAEEASILDTPTVNHIFGNAYYRSNNNSEAAFWLGIATARCSAASSLAFELNQGMEELFSSKRKGYFGNRPPAFWDDLSYHSKQSSIVMLELFEQNYDNAVNHFEIIFEMSNKLYLAQLNMIDESGFPNWKMLASDLVDCSDFFMQDSDKTQYRPRKQG